MIVRAFLLKDPLDLFVKRALGKPALLPEEDELLERVGACSGHSSTVL